MSALSDLAFGLTSALGYGTGDFLARQASHRIGHVRVLFFLEVFGMLVFLPIAAWFERDLWAATDPWALLVALGAINFLASLWLYRSFEYGVLSIVSPLASSYPAVTATLAFLVLGERPAALAPAAAPKRSAETTIDDVFLLYRDGLLIKHETRRLKPDIDTDILSGMLTAVQQFVKDSFRSEEGDLDELTFGQMHILIGRGKWVILAAMIQGDGTDTMMEQVKRCVQDVEDHQWDQLDGWDGDMVIAKVLSPYVKKLIRGEYA